MAEVYIIGVADGRPYYKVGMSEAPKRRLKELQGLERRRLILKRATSYGLTRREAFELERWIHNDMDTYRVGREWFVCPYWRVWASMTRGICSVLLNEPPEDSLRSEDRKFCQTLMTATSHEKAVKEALAKMVPSRLAAGAEPAPMQPSGPLSVGGHDLSHA